MNTKRKLTNKLINRFKSSQFFILGLLFSCLTFNTLQAQCIIGELTIEHSGCNNLNEFTVDIDFDWAGGTDSFSVVGNGNNYGHYSKFDLPVTIISPFFIGDGTTIYEFLVQDLDLPLDCSNSGTIGPVTCGPNNDCGITNITYFLSPCNPNDQFYVTLDFDWEFTSDFFTVIGNGMDYGTFSYTEVPLTLGAFPGDGSTVWEFGIFDLNFPDCGGWVEPGIVNCPPLGDCEITDFVIEPIDCGPNGTQSIYIDFNVVNSPNDYFDLIDANGNNLGYFLIADLPLIWDGFVPSGNDYDVLHVCINDTPDCCSVFEFMPLDCNNNCEIWDLVVEAHPCNNLGMFSVDIDFNYANTSDSFTVVGNGQNYGTFAYSDLYITLGPLVGDGSVYEFIIQDQNHPDCGGELILQSENCIGGDCHIYDLAVETGDCNNDGTYTLWINFEHDNAGNDFFDVINANGEVIGYFPLSELPVAVTYGPSNGNFEVVTVCINDNPNCCGSIEFDPPNCNNNNCEIWDLVAEAHSCDDQGMFLVDIDFNHANTSDSFTVVGNGQNYGTFAYSDLYITLGPLVGDGSVYEFIIQDQDNPDCAAEIGLESENCSGGDCDIYDLVVETGDCNDDGTYLIVINFEYQNPGNDHFDVIGANGNVLYTFSLAELPVTISHFQGNGGDFDWLMVCINDTPNCCEDIEFEAPNCNNNNCEIWDLVAEAHSCDDQGMFYVDIDFNYANTSDSFTVISSGPTYSTFAYTDLFITLGPFEGNGTVYEFIIQDQNDPDCGGFLLLVSDNCNGGACDIYDLTVDPGDCNNDGTYTLWINFEYQNANNDFFDVINANGEVIGYFPLSELPVAVTYGPSNGNFDVVQVCINDNPNCCESIEFDPPNCNNNNCEIWDLVAEAHSCDDQGMFLVDIDFNHANTSDSFTVVGNGLNYGTFAYSDLYITLGPLVGDGSVYEFIIQDQDNPDCSAEIGLESENCSGGDCDIYDLVVETGDCNDDGTYLIVINFEYQNPGNDHFDVIGANGNVLYTFSLAELPVTISHFQGNGGDFDWLLVCINDTPNCCEDIEFEAPNCANNCEIWDLVVEAHACDDQGMFLVDIDFNHAYTSDSFTVVGNGQNYGTFAYSDLYITLGPFVGDGSVYEFIIQDQNHPDCEAEWVILSENCNGGDCDISDLNVYPLDCNPDGTYSLLILFDYENVTGDFFDVYANGDYLESYAYDDLPLSIPSFPGSGNDNDVITICDNDSDLCCETLEFEALDCEACEIYDVVATPGPCDDNDNFMVSLDFEHVGGGSLGFMVLGNGNNYGIFDYADLPISLGPFAGDGITEYEFIIVDLVNTDCIGYTVLDPVLCNIPPPVWPGDINNDNLSNNFDLLHLGIAFGEAGPPRPQTNIDWASWAGPNWTQSFIDGTNMKHADCNGDGLVDNLDLTAIDINYNKVHGDVIPYDTISISADDPPFYIDLPTADQIEIGEAFTAPIVLGSLETPVESIYGIAFTIEYDPSMMDEAGVYVETTNSWLGNQGTQLVNINKNFSDDGIIEVAITRIDHNNTNGFGTISYFIGIIDDIAGKNEVKINITNVVAITYEEARVALAASSSIIDLTTSVNDISEMDVTIFPNPAKEMVTILTEGEKAPESISIYNSLGQKVTQIFTPEKWQTVDVGNWAPGIYFVDLQFAEGKFSKKIKVSK